MPLTLRSYLFIPPQQRDTVCVCVCVCVCMLHVDVDVECAAAAGRGGRWSGGRVLDVAVPSRFEK